MGDFRAAQPFIHFSSSHSLGKKKNSEKITTNSTMSAAIPSYPPAEIGTAGVAGAAPGLSTFRNASLYVGDLAADVNEVRPPRTFASCV